MADVQVDGRFALRNDTSQNWMVTNPTLLRGELGIETDTGKFKFGDGMNAWNDLSYYSPVTSGAAIGDETGNARNSVKLGGLPPEAFIQPQHNLVINGAMNIWQRGTYFERCIEQGTSAYTADGYEVRTFGNAHIIISKETADLPAGFVNAMKISIKQLQIATGEEHIINRVHCDITVPGIYTASCMTKGPAGSSAAFTFDTAVKIHTFSGQWERVTVTKQMDAGYAYPFDTLRNPQPVGDYYVTGVKIEAGDKYTGWDYEEPVKEAARCYRRFIRLRPTGSYMYPIGNAAESAEVLCPVLYPPVPMRILPWVGFSGNFALHNSGSIIPVTRISNDGNTSIKVGSDIVGVGISCGGVGLVPGTYYTLSANNDPNAYLDLDADIH